LNPIGSAGQKTSRDNTIIKSPLYYFNCRNAEDDLGYETDIESIVNVILCYVVVVCKSAAAAIEETESNGVSDASEAINNEINMGFGNSHEKSICSQK
jgi:hypothetical protein